EYTNEVIDEEQHERIDSTSDVYGDGKTHDEILTTIRTAYENRFLGEGKKITYVSFRLKKNYGESVRVFPFNGAAAEKE
ncbi:MAG TPA: hypothetical protein VFU15_14010, partial [Bacteroidia bacterium]|nr:hypothetical protein [Bacteroidia bacterium]